MTRLTIAIAVSAVLVAGNAMAQATQTTPPPVQIPPPTGTQQKPATPPATPAPKPAATPVPFPPEAKVRVYRFAGCRARFQARQERPGIDEVLNDKLGAALAAKNKEIQALQEKMKAQQSVVSDAVYNGMAKDLERLGREAQFMQQDAQVQNRSENAETARRLPGERCFRSSKKCARKRASGSSSRSVRTPTSRRRTPASISPAKSSSASTPQSNRLTD
jgi:hypothetical protein